MGNRTSLISWLLPPVAGAAVLAVWGMAFWGVLYEPLRVFHDTTPAIAQAADILSGAETETGTYFHPWPRNTTSAMATWLQQHRMGPFFKLSYVREGVDPQSLAKMTRGLALYVLVAALATGLVTVAGIAPGNRVRAASAITAGGAMGTLLIQIGDPVWFHLPWDYVLGNLVFELVAWALLGVTVAWARKPVFGLRQTGSRST